MTSIGFVIGGYNANTYDHKERGLKTMVHGDVFVTVGNREGGKWMDAEFKKRFEIKTGVIGEGPGEVKEAKILNRVVRVGSARLGV